MLAALALLLATSFHAAAAPRNAVDALVRRLMREGDVPGLSLVVMHGSRVAWHQAYGVANAQTGAPLTDRAVFESASLTKPVFAYAVLKLVDAGVLSLDVPLQRYLPESVADERMKLITARMVLDHTTGFQNEVMPGQTLTVHFTPGTRFSYSGAGYLYLQRVVEKVTGKALPALMQELVFTPLAMRDSGYVWTDDYETREVYGHDSTGRAAERRKPTVATVATLHTTPRDYAKFVAAILQRRGLSAATYATMFTPQVQIDESCFSCLTKSSGTMSPSLFWGLGWAIERTQRGNAFFHWGENNGEFQHFVMGYPNGDALVIFTNSGNGLSIIPDIVTAVLGREHPAFAWMGYEHYDAPAKKLFRAVMRHGAAAALRDGMAEPLSESRLNDIGYMLLRAGRAADAVALFERNAERFPQSANAYDSLGEGYAAAGQREKAVSSYARSLQLDPKNTNAAEWLQKLRGAL